MSLLTLVFQPSLLPLSTSESGQMLDFAAPVFLFLFLLQSERDNSTAKSE